MGLHEPLARPARPSPEGLSSGCGSRPSGGVLTGGGVVASRPCSTPSGRDPSLPYTFTLICMNCCCFCKACASLLALLRRSWQRRQLVVITRAVGRFAPQTRSRSSDGRKISWIIFGCVLSLARGRCSMAGTFPALSISRRACWRAWPSSCATAGGMKEARGFCSLKSVISSCAESAVGCDECWSGHVALAIRAYHAELSRSTRHPTDSKRQTTVLNALFAGRVTVPRGCGPAGGHW